MAYYLSMDGVDDYLSAPLATANKIVFDAYVVKPATDFKTLVKFIESNKIFYSQNNTNGYGKSEGTVTVDGVANAPIVSGTRQTIQWSLNAYTNKIDFFGTSGNSGWSGKVYDIKIYNGATLVAHYDMTTQTVQDQSGNGRHATLTGGTWVDDGAGGTPVTVNSIVATNAISMSSPAVTTTSNAVINSVSSQFTASAANPAVDAQQQVTIFSVVTNVNATSMNPILTSNANTSISVIVATANTQSVSPDIIADSPNASVSSVMAVVSTNAVSPIIGIDNNVVSVVLNVVISAKNPIVEIVNDVDYFEKIIRRTLSVTTKHKTNLNINRSYKSTLDI